MPAQPPPEDTTLTDNPRFTISNNWLAFIALMLFMVTQAKDMVVSWAEARMKQAAINESVESMAKSIATLEKEAASLRTDVEKVRGDVKAESGRAYEVDQGMQRQIDQNNAAIKKLEQQTIKTSATP